jgi:FkbM family methyltransferase
MKYYAHKHGIDKYIHQNLITKSFTDGTFLELGAIDGVKFSNTKFFEDNMGFNQGVLIEPDPQSFERLKVNRPNCECFHYAIHSSLKEVEFLQSQQNAVGCIDSIASDTFKSRFHKSSQKIKVPSTTLSNILNQSKLKYIDFWSLDVEGSEVECLNSMDWNIPIGLLCIELHQNINEIIKILKAKEFTLLHSFYDGNKLFFNYKYFRKEFFNIK